MKKLMMALFVVMMMAVTTACQQTPEKEVVKEETVSAFPLTVTDVTGAEITLEKQPEKIVSMIPSNTEILFELGLEQQITAVSDYDNYPEAALSKEKIGGMEFNVEKIISLSPDLVLAHESALGTWDAGLQQLRDAGIQVYTVKNAEDFNTTYETIQEIAKLTGTEQQAEKIIADMKANVEKVIDATKDMQEKSVLIEVSPQPDIYTSASGTLLDNMLKMIGAKNAAADLTGWVMLNSEQIIERNPDVIMTTYGAYTPGAIEQVLTRPGFEVVTAVKNKAVVDVDADMTSRMGPRLDDAFLIVAKAVYPEAFQ